MANDLRFQGVRMTTSTNVTGSSTTVGLPDSRGLTSDWQAGTHFSRYEIESELATGGMAEVWRAKLKGCAGSRSGSSSRRCCRSWPGRPDLVEMFINEATLRPAFSHPNIAHVFDFGQLEGRYFIAMEYVPGVTLRFAHKRMLARGELLPMAATLHVMIDVCEALQEVHELADAQRNARPHPPRPQPRQRHRLDQRGGEADRLRRRAGDGPHAAAVGSSSASTATPRPSASVAPPRIAAAISTRPASCSTSA